MQFLRSAAAGQGYHHVGGHNSDSPREDWNEEESEVDRHESQASDAGEKAERQRAFLKRCSIVTVAASLTAFGIQLYVYNVVFLGRILPAVGKQAVALPSGILFNLLWCLAIWSYFSAHLADPGKVPQEWYEFVDRTGEDLLVEAPRMEWQPGRASLCSKCMLPRPERAHHCFVCGICVLRMDHHCPWINNCVGYKNHKFFLLLGSYACLACYAFVATTLPELLLCAALFAGWEGDKHQERRAGLLQATEGSVLDPSDAYWLLGACCFAGMAAAALTALLCVHVPLAGQNSTTIEDNYENMPNPFDQGNSLQNLAQVFGEPGSDWFFPVAPRRPLSDGISFQRFGEDVFCHSLPVAPQDQAEPDLLWRSRYRVRSRRRPDTEQPVQQDDGPVTMLARFLLGTGSGGGPKVQQAGRRLSSCGGCHPERAADPLLH